MTPEQWIERLDAVIDRQVKIYPPEWIPWVMHRWVERQMQSIEKLPPLVPSWVYAWEESAASAKELIQRWIKEDESAPDGPAENSTDR